MQIRRARLVPAVAAVAALAGAGSAQAATRDVSAGPPLTKPPKGVAETIVLNQFFPKTTTVHVGDRVRWGVFGFHTITFLGGTARFSWVGPVPGQAVSGQNDAAGSPFWFNGQPLVDVNPAAAGPTPEKSFAGTGLRNSGFPQEPPKPYTLTFTKEGTFRYLCLLHPLTMRGTIRVVHHGRVASARAHQRAAKRQVASAIRQGKALHKSKGPRGNVVYAGNGKRNGIDDIKFFPQSKTIRAGTTLRLQQAPFSEEVHNFAFGDANYLKQRAEAFQNGNDPISFYASDPPGSLVVTPTAHGNGFVNTGLLDVDPLSTLPDHQDVRFAQAGTYKYICLFHGPEMNGTITVTP
jgi:plastocyanin